MSLLKNTNFASSYYLIKTLFLNVTEVFSFSKSSAFESKNGQFLQPVARNVKDLTDFFEEALKNINTESFEKWKPENRILAKSGHVLIFSGAWENLASIKRADNLMWTIVNSNPIQLKKLCTLLPDQTKLK